MQANQTKKQINDARLLQLQNHWSVVEEAFRIEGRERQTDIFLLKEQLQERQCKQRMVDDHKGEIFGHTLSKLNRSAQETKQNTEKLFQRETQFKINHLDKKNEFIQNYLNVTQLLIQDGNIFNSTLQQYVRDNINDVDAKLQSTDAANIAKTKQVVKKIKEEVIADAQNCFSKEKDKYMQLFNKISSDSINSMHKLREKLKAKKKQRGESVAKLRLMVNGLIEQLSKIYDKQSKQCEMKYESLLKLLEQCCAKIQEAQLK